MLTICLAYRSYVLYIVDIYVFNKHAGHGEGWCYVLLGDCRSYVLLLI